MNQVPFWLPAALTVLLTLLLGAFLLPTVIAVYRAENWLFTWPLPEWDRGERRAAFEVQLEEFLSTERDQGYPPQSSGVRLLLRLLTTLVRDLYESGSAAARRARSQLSDVDINRRLRTMFPRLFGPRLDKGTGRYRRTSSNLLEDTVETPTIIRFEEEPIAVRSNAAMMDSAIQVVRQNVSWRNTAHHAAVTSMGRARTFMPPPGVLR